MLPSRTKLLGLLLLLAHAAGASAEDILSLLPADCAQAILVQTEDWTAVTGTLVLHRRTPDGWTPELTVPAVNVGRSGMGWGVGLHATGPAEDPQKNEGDGRAPAGIFRLDTGFGYALEAPGGNRGWPYRQCTPEDWFVDDPKSTYYNSWQNTPEGASRAWDSAESMLRKDDLYRLGLVVGHNLDRPIAGRGSAIFLHIWRAPGSGTAGCTAMPAADMERLLRLLDPAAKPVLVQGPRSVMKSGTLKVFRAARKP